MRIFFVWDVDVFGRHLYAEHAVEVEAEDERAAAKMWALDAIEESGEASHDGAGARCIVSRCRGGEEGVEFIIRQAVEVKRTLTLKEVAT